MKIKLQKQKELLEKLSNPQITINESLKLYNDGLKELELAQKLLEEAKLVLLLKAITLDKTLYDSAFITKH